MFILNSGNIFLPNRLHPLVIRLLRNENPNWNCDAARRSFWGGCNRLLVPGQPVANRNHANDVVWDWKSGHFIEWLDGFWGGDSKILDFLNNNNTYLFQLLYLATTNRRLPINMKRRALLISLILPIVSTVSVIITHVTMVDFRVDQVVPYCILDSITYMLGGYWYLMCELLSSSANVLAEDFQTVRKCPS